MQLSQPFATYRAASRVQAGDDGTMKFHDSVERLASHHKKLISAFYEKKETEGEKIALKRGEQLFSKGDPSNGLYLLTDGEIDVEIPRDRSKSLTINTLTAPCIFGELALFGDLQRTATCRCASEKSVLWKFDNATALARIDADKELRIGFMHHLSLISANTLIYAEELGALAQEVSTDKSVVVRSRLQQEASLGESLSSAKASFLKMLDEIHEREQSLIDKVHFLELELIRQQARAQADQVTGRADFSDLQSRAQAMRARRSRRAGPPSPS